MARCGPGHDAITGRKMKVTMDSDALTLVAKKEGMTKHGYINANPDVIFQIWYPCGIFIVFNELPNAYIYELH